MPMLIHLPPPVMGGAVLLNTGFYMPKVGLGLRGYTATTKPNVRAVIEAGLILGYRMFDTAKEFNNEKDIGDALEFLLPRFHLERKDIFIITKCFPSQPYGELEHWIEQNVKLSLKNLKTTYVDLYLLQYPTWRAGNQPADTYINLHHLRQKSYMKLQKMKLEGHIHSIGVANFEDKHMDEITTYKGMDFYGRNLEPDVPAVNQCEFHPHFTRKAIREECKKTGTVFMVHSPLADANKVLTEDKNILPVVESFDDDMTTTEQVILAFALCQEYPVVCRSCQPLHMSLNMLASAMVLTDEQKDLLESLDRGSDGNYTPYKGFDVD